MNDTRNFDEAVAWLMQQDDPDFDWDGLTRWLEADQRNRTAYDEASLLYDALDRQHADLEFGDVAANDNSRRWWVWTGISGAVAAAAAFLLISPQSLISPSETSSIYLTRAGETRTVTLRNNVDVTLAPRSRLEAKGDNLKLDGEAIFAVAHLPARTLHVSIGPLEIRDIGTEFTAQSSPMPTIEVAEGSLTVIAGGSSAVVSAGQSARLAQGRLRVSKLATSTIGDWHDGQLYFSDAPLKLVAEQLTRYSSQSVSVDRAVENQRFTGVVAIGGEDRPAEAVAAVMGLSTRRDGRNVRISSTR